MSVPDTVTRRTALLGSLFSLAACGGGGGGNAPDVPPPPPPSPPVVPVDGPAWFGFARNAQHTALGEIATQSLTTLWWSTPVDLTPPYSSSGALLVHYGSPVITRRNTVVLPVRTGANNAFRVDARIGANGALLWSLDTSYRLPPHHWLPSLNPVLTPDVRLFVPASGGRVLERAGADAASGALRTLVFYGEAAYNADPATYDASVFINTPLTSDSAGNVFFGFTVTGANAAGLTGGIARLGVDGSVRWVRAADVAGDPAMVKTATNSAPALANDERTLYVVVNNLPPSGVRASGRLLALDAATLALKYNSYGGIGSGDGQHRVAIVDPNATQTDRFSSALVMQEVITVLGPTPDDDYPGGVKEWCINTAAVDLQTSSVLMNSEDGYLYRWHLPSNTLAERIRMNNGYAQSYTPTAIGPDGRVYAVNNARLFSVGG